MTDLLRFLIEWAYSVLTYLASYARYYAKLRRRVFPRHHMPSPAAPTMPPSPRLCGPWNKRPTADRFTEDPVPAAKRAKDGQVPMRTPGPAVRGGDDSVRVERGAYTSWTGPTAVAGTETAGPVEPQPVQMVTEGTPTKMGGAPALMLRKRPSMIVVPDQSGTSDAKREFEREAAARKRRDEQHAAAATSCSVTEAQGYCVASRKGNRQPTMEDGHDAITNIDGDPKHAYFGVYDGHGGRAAVDFVGRNLGSNIVAAMRQAEQSPEEAIRSAYAATDRDFVTQNLRGGACVATVVIKDGILHAANAGDCRVVLSRGGVARALTSDHRAGREDERHRIESTGGFVSCYGGGAVWRVQDSLSVTRSIGDAQLKQWVIPDPEVTELRLLQDSSCSDCDDDFLILASDGLWDCYANQEAVDVVLANGGCGARAARVLADGPVARGGRDDVTVMLVRLRGFV